MVVILGAIGAIGAALTRGIWACSGAASVGQGRGPLSPCLAPSLAIFVYSTLVSAEQGRVAAFVSYFLGVLVFVALADRTDGPAATRPAAPGTPAGTPAPTGASGARGRRASWWRSSPSRRARGCRACGSRCST